MTKFVSNRARAGLIQGECGYVSFFSYCNTCSYYYVITRTFESITHPDPLAHGIRFDFRCANKVRILTKTLLHPDDLVITSIANPPRNKPAINPPDQVRIKAAGLATSFPTELDYDCSGLPDNFIYWWACGSYGICRGGQYTQIDCINGTSYDRRNGDCVPNSQSVTFPCQGDQGQCVSHPGPGQRFPDQTQDPVEGLPPCTFYFTCSYGRYLGHQKCSQGTVYDEPQQRCLPPSMVAPPCGTLTEDRQSNLQPVRQVVQPITDNFGNPDYNRWPFNTNINQGYVQGRPQY
ncbi:hypothetical protein PoB_000300100 [Plakobranchus ocellatus]|uniref:Chitin-binding type-2 domain-containing protein n=1 Tax=Plakobranchus ocellatus TaxID=259542 RepID=A0AAV3Y289_9GAST|nr:hypothetical protein PoB_000300100 [Plakobranchus ocellatus]